MTELKTNSLKKKLQTKNFVVGTFLEVPSPAVAEILGLSGFDFVVIDCEHGTIGLRDAEDLIRACGSTDVSPVVRVAHCEPVSIRQPLDMGAVGIHVPQVESAEMARLAVQSAKFFPTGNRGLQPFVRGASYRAYSTAEFMKNSNHDSTVVVHIEGSTGLAGLDDILRVEALDVVFLGPYDLSQSLGVPGQIRHPKILEAIQEMVRKAKNSGKWVGAFCDDLELAIAYRNLGVSYLAISMDSSIFLSAGRAIVSEIKN